MVRLIQLEYTAKNSETKIYPFLENEDCRFEKKNAHFEEKKSSFSRKGQIFFSGFFAV